MCSYDHMPWSFWSPLIKNVEIIYIKPIYACVGVIKSRLLLLASNLWFWKLCDRLGWCRRCSFHLSRIWFKTIHVGITNNLLWKLANYHMIACESRFFFIFNVDFTYFLHPRCCQIGVCTVQKFPMQSTLRSGCHFIQTSHLFKMSQKLNQLAWLRIRICDRSLCSCTIHLGAYILTIIFHASGARWHDI